MSLHNVDISHPRAESCNSMFISVGMLESHSMRNALPTISTIYRGINTLFASDAGVIRHLVLLIHQKVWSGRCRVEQRSMLGVFFSIVSAKSNVTSTGPRKVPIDYSSPLDLHYIASTR